MSYAVQRDEGMHELAPADGALARKYCGGGFGGYALYLFESAAKRDAFVAATAASDKKALAVEPFCERK